MAAIRPPLKIFCFVMILALVPLLTVRASYGVETSLPLTLDYKLLSMLLEKEAFTDPGKVAAIVGTRGDCTFLAASQPRFSSVNGNLQLELRLSVQLGTDLGGNCVMPVNWEGYLVIVQQPIFDGQTFSLSFKSIKAGIFGADRKPATIVGMLWDFVQPSVFRYLARIHIDLAPPVNDLKNFMQPLFPEDTQQATAAMLDSMRGGKVSVEEDGVIVELLADVQEVYDPEDEIFNMRPLSSAEQAQITQLWETWDSFLVQLLVLMAVHPLSEEDHQILIDVLLDTRYVFTAALEENTVNEDFVRKQFIEAWKRLAPIFRRQLLTQPSDNNLGYLGFFTAADALSVLDSMGPTLGIEISRNGLLRLAKMLTGSDDPLLYDSTINGQLRNLFELPPAPQDQGPAELPPEDGIPTGDAPESDPLTLLLDFLVHPVAAGKIPPYEQILSWKVPRDDIDGYFKRVRGVVTTATENQLGKKSLNTSLWPMFRVLIPAMAWQESCYRQFVEKHGKLTYLLSYNQSSVGLMQVNERVWHGIYDRDQLRWNINYNAQAGCEIAELYLHRYILKKAPATVAQNPDLLAKLVYALYNGGPGQYQKFLAREKSGKRYKSDELFAEKLSWVKKNAWDKIKQCLSGG